MTWRRLLPDRGRFTNPQGPGFPSAPLGRLRGREEGTPDTAPPAPGVARSRPGTQALVSRRMNGRPATRVSPSRGPSATLGVAHWAAWFQCLFQE